MVRLYKQTKTLLEKIAARNTETEPDVFWRIVIQEARSILCELKKLD